MSVSAEPIAEQTTDVAATRSLLIAGDEAYLSGDFQSATTHFREALAVSPTDAANASAKVALQERYAQAATEQARDIIQIGRYGEARALLESVLAADMRPNYSAASQLLEELDDPIRTNPALTVEHSRNIEKVAHLLRKGLGFIDLGEFDNAERTLKQVLAIDPYNKAARRGMERSTNLRSNYYDSAYDQTRSKLLEQVEAGWELEVGAPISEASQFEFDLVSESATETVLSRLKSTELETVILEDVTLGEAVDYLRVQSIALDPRDIPESQKGVNMTIDGPLELRNRLLTVKLRGVPLSAALQFVTEATQTRWSSDDFAVKIFDQSADAELVVTRSWRVPPDFLSRSALGPVGDSGDVFDETSSSDSLLVKSLTAKEFFEQKGVVFGEDAFANFLPGSGTLTVRNTAQNIEIVDQMVTIIAQQSPVAVRIRTNIIRINQENLEELGFDQFLSPQTGGDLTVSGGSGLASVDGALPLTGGLRSGNQALPARGINQVISQAFDSNSSPLARQAGPLSISSFDSDTGDLQFFSLLRGVNNKRSIDVSSQPSVITRPGQRATIKQVREFIYPTEYEPPETPDGGGQDVRFVPPLLLEPSVGLPVFIDREIILTQFIDSEISRLSAFAFTLASDRDLVNLSNATAVYVTLFNPGAITVPDLVFLTTIPPAPPFPQPVALSGADRARLIEIFLRVQPMLPDLDIVVVTPAAPTAFETREVGVILEAEATVSTDRKTLSLSINPSIVEFDGFVNYGEPIFNINVASEAGSDGEAQGSLITTNDILQPIFSKISEETSIDIVDGGTIVIGGLLSSQVELVDDSTPILGDLPIIGRFFQNQIRQRSRQAIIISVTVDILDPTGKKINP